MQFAIQVAGWAVGIPLQILIMAAMLRGPARRYPFVFAYTVLSFLATVVEIPAYVAHFTGGAQAIRPRAYLYWLNEGILLPLLFVVVISLIWQATAKMSSRRVLHVIVISGAFLFAVVTFLIRYDSGSAAVGLWMTPWSRDLSFCSAVLNLGLWTLLIAGRVKDRQLFMLSGGLGIQFAGQAMGGSIRQIAVSLYPTPTPTALRIVFAGNIVFMVANLAALYVWRRAFQTESLAEPASKLAVRGTGV